MNVLGVVAGDGNVAEQTAEQPGARVGDFVEGKPRLGNFGEDRQKTGAGGRLENDVGRRQRGRLGCDEAERDRRGKLLQLFGFLRPARL